VVHQPPAQAVRRGVGGVHRGSGDDRRGVCPLSIHPTIPAAPATGSRQLWGRERRNGRGPAAAGLPGGGEHCGFEGGPGGTAVGAQLVQDHLTVEQLEINTIQSGQLVHSSVSYQDRGQHGGLLD
jgi:hypothetical protein